MPDRSSSHRPLEVVFVCTGNRARSPLAEALFRKYAAGFETAVASAGTMKLGPAPALPEAIAAARRLGVDLAGHRARALAPGALADSDLVLGFEPAHLSTAVVDGHAHPSRTFLLGELVRLLDSGGVDPDPAEGARRAVATANARRVRSRPDVTHVIADPYGQPAKAMRRTAAEIDRLVQALVGGLFGLEVPRETPRARRLLGRGRRF